MITAIITGSQSRISMREMSRKSKINDCPPQQECKGHPSELITHATAISWISNAKIAP